MSITKKIVLTLLCILSIVLGTGYFLGLAYFQTHFKIGTTINGFHCSFKTIEETETLLSRKVESYAIAVDTRNNGVEKIAANDVGLAFVGKSTLVNALAGTEIMKTGEIREKDAKGRHTTTYREMIELPNNVVIIDTPGMREIGLCDVDEGIDDTFEDIAELAAQCRFRDCTHTNEPRCAVRQALENGQLSKERFELYRSLHVESRKSADMKAIAKARKALNKTRKR